MCNRLCAILLVLAAFLTAGCEKPPKEQQEESGSKPSAAPGKAMDAQDHALAGARLAARAHREILLFFERFANLRVSLPQPPKIDADLTRDAAALSALREGRYAQGAEHLRHLLRSNPDDPALLRALATALVASNQIPEAAKVYRALLKQDPQSAATRYNLALALTRMGRLTQAEMEFQRLLDLHPHHAQGLANLGMLYVHLQEYTSAAAHLEQAVELLPERPRLRAALGQALLLTGRARDAMQQFGVQVRLQPEDLLAWRNYSMASFEAGSFGRALAATQKCLEITRSQPQTLQCVAQIACLHLSPPRLSQQVGHLAESVVLAHAAEAPRTAEAAFHRDLGEIHWAIYRTQNEPRHRSLAMQEWNKSLEILHQPDLARKIHLLEMPDREP